MLKALVGYDHSLSLSLSLFLSFVSHGEESQQQFRHHRRHKITKKYAQKESTPQKNEKKIFEVEKNKVRKFRPQLKRSMVLPPGVTVGGGIKKKCRRSTRQPLSLSFALSCLPSLSSPLLPPASLSALSFVRCLAEETS